MEKKLDGNYPRMLLAVLNKFWRQPAQNSSYMATYYPSRKLSKLDEPDMRDTAEAIYSCGPLYMDEHR